MRDIRIGHRSPRKWEVAIGILLTLSPLTIPIREINPQRLKPAWWLRYELKHSATSQAAMTELLRRLDAGQLSEHDINLIADKCLAEQAKRNVPWQRFWGDFVENADRQEKLDRQRFAIYARQAFSFQPIAESGRQGSSIDIGLRFAFSRVSCASFDARVEYLDFQVNGRTMGRVLPTGHIEPMLSFQYGAATVANVPWYHLDEQDTKSLSPGNHKCIAKLKVWVSKPGANFYKVDPLDVVATFDTELTGNINIFLDKLAPSDRTDPGKEQLRKIHGTTAPSLN